MLSRLLHAKVLTHAFFLIVILAGIYAYASLPRQQDPTINFNWLVISTALPGASSDDVELKITNPIEDAIASVADIRFVTSTSRDGISLLLLRFHSIPQTRFDKHVAQIRREISRIQSTLPNEARDPVILEITSANAFPAATIALSGASQTSQLHSHAANVMADLRRIVGVSRIQNAGLREVELQILLNQERLLENNVSPQQVANSVQRLFDDKAMGNRNVGNQEWTIRQSGSTTDAKVIADWPILNTPGTLQISDVAQVQLDIRDAQMLGSYQNRPAVVLFISKSENSNTLALVERLEQYIATHNQKQSNTSFRLDLIDDQTPQTKRTLGVMESNALLGLSFVLLATALFLGFKVAFLTAIGIPFILSGTFIFVFLSGETLNVTVLLGVVIVLGMLVDDAVVVVEAIYQKLRIKHDLVAAVKSAFVEVGSPVLTAVLTTIATFLPLTLVPGIVGDFMRVVPTIVTIALLISLVEAFWILPSHVVLTGVHVSLSRGERLRRKLMQRLRHGYITLLIPVVRRPVRSLIAIVLLILLVPFFGLSSGAIKVDFFAGDPIRLFYIDINEKAGTPVAQTLAKVNQASQVVKQHLPKSEYRSLVSYAGSRFTETEYLIGKQYGQVLVSLNPVKAGGLSPRQLAESIKPQLQAVLGEEPAFMFMDSGPPKTKPIEIKIVGDNYARLYQAKDRLYQLLKGIEGVTDISDDAILGSRQIKLSLNMEALQQFNVQPEAINTLLTMLADGQSVAQTRYLGQNLEVRVRLADTGDDQLGDFLNNRLLLDSGKYIRLKELVDVAYENSLSAIRHFNFRRAVTVSADLDPNVNVNEIEANQRIQDAWSEIAAEFPDISLDTSGLLDDIAESLTALQVLMLLGMGLVYLILGTQFNSYWQPFMILLTCLPSSLAGALGGLLISGYPLSLFTLYGVVALLGIAVNTAIVLVSAANQRLAQGMSPTKAIILAGKRRLVPIFITTATTIAGLSSLALGFGGSSLLWGPIATVIVAGLGFSALISLFLLPVLYRLTIKPIKPAPDSFGA